MWTIADMREKLTSIQAQVGRQARVVDEFRGIGWKPPKQKYAKNGYVYFIQSSSGEVKIGWAVHPESRLVELQISNPLELSLLCVMKGNRNLEGQIHRKYKAFRICGEWFYPAEELMEFIKNRQFLRTEKDKT